MKKFEFFALTAMLLFAFKASATTINVTDKFYCEFTTQQDYGLWTVTDKNGPDQNGSNCFWWNEEQKAAYYAPGTSMSGDDWIVSPAVKLSGGKSYVLTTNFLSDWGSSRLTITMGKGNQVEDQTIVLEAEKEYANSNNLKIDLPADLQEGTYYFAIHATTESWGADLYIYNFGVAVSKGESTYWGFRSQDEFNLWKTTDINGADDNENKFSWNENEGAAFLNPGSSKPADDWLISPAAELKAGKSYILKANLFCDGQCLVAFSMGKEQNPDKQTTLLRIKKTYEGEKYLRFQIPESIAPGTYYFGIHCTTQAGKGALYVKNIEVAEANDATLNVKVQDKASKELLSGATVRIYTAERDAREAKTGNNGEAKFDFVSPDNYTIGASIDDYKPGKITVDISPKEQVTQVIELEKILKTTLAGHVIDSKGQPIGGATVTINGNTTYAGTTDERGYFSIPGIIRPKTYTITIAKKRMIDYSHPFEANEETINLGDITLQEILFTPANVHTDETERGMFVSWMIPTQYYEFRKDNGKYVGQYEFNSDYVYMGNVFNEPMIVSSIRWAAKSNHETMDVYLFPLDKDGSYSSTPCFEKKGVASQTYDSDNNTGWSEYILEQPIELPYGGIVAVGHGETLNIAGDYQGGWSSVMSFNDLSTGWRSSTVQSLFIRATGLGLATDYVGQAKAYRSLKTPAPRLVMRRSGETDNQDFTFTVWRMKASDKDKTDQWTKVTERQKSLYTIDEDFAKLQSGYYLYAVRTIYDNGRETPVTFSDPVEHNVYTKVVVNVFTNTAVDFSDGTVVTLTALDNANSKPVYTASVQKGKALFGKVEKGNYKLAARKNGFKEENISSLELTTDNSYTFDVDLTLEPAAPFNLSVDQAEAKLTWNSAEALTDDFETTEDFEINPRGKLNWSYIDGDGEETYGVKQCQDTPYPNMYKPMAFMAFNPTATTPDITEFVQPHSGKKVLVSVSLSTGGRNDDWLISPELAFDTDFSFSFHAASGFFSQLGDEEFMVGYTTSAEVSPEKTIWLTKEPQTVGSVWTKFAYTLPKEAKHAIVRCVSNQHMFFMIDDVEIGFAEPETFQMCTFNVRIDNEDYTTTANRSVSVKELEKGVKHIAKVQTVYTLYDMSKVYSDFSELVFTLDETAPVDQVTAPVKLYGYDPQTKKLEVDKSVKNAALYDMQGRLMMKLQSGIATMLNHVPAGVYILNLTKEDGQPISNKIVVR